MTRFLVRLATFALLAVFTASCSSARRSRPGSQPAVRTTITVENQTFNDMNIFVLNGGQRVRLGQVTSHNKSEFNIPATIVGSARELTFLAEPITRRGGTISNAIWVQPGDNVVMIIPP